MSIETQISPPAPRRNQRPLTRSLQAAFDRVTRLAALANVLCGHRSAAAFAGGSLASSLSFIARELDHAARELARRVPMLGARGRVARGSARKGQSAGAFTTLLARLRAGCVACGQRLSALLGPVREADTACAQIVYELLRSLERQLWLLQPYTKSKGPNSSLVT